MSVLLEERRDRVVVATFNDPDRRNVVSSELNDALLDAFDRWEADDGVGAVVLTGAGRAFCAGAVLDDLLETAQDEGGALPSIYSGFLRVAHSTLPTIAAVNGAAVGAGMNMALAADVILAGERARFDTRFLQIAIHPGGGHTWRLRHLTDTQTAKAMVLFGQVLDGQDAARRGVAWECVADDELVDRAVEMAERAASFPKALVASTKNTFHAGYAVTDSVSSVELEVGPQATSMASDEFQQTVAALKSQISSKS